MKERDTYDQVSEKIDWLPFPHGETERVEYRQNRLEVLEQGGWTEVEWEEENERRVTVALSKWFGGGDVDGT